MGRSDGHLYVYGLADAGLPARFTVRRHALRTVPVPDLRSKLVAIVEVMTARPEPTVENLQTQHEIVTKLADRVPALIPARFGSLMSEKALGALAETHREAIADALRRVRECAQMTVRVFGSPDLPAPSLPRAASGTAFLEQRRARAHYVPAEVGTIRKLLKMYVKEERVEPGERMLRVAVFHLVPRASIEEYRHEAATLPAILVPHQVTVSGPSPAFAFAPELF